VTAKDARECSRRIRNVSAAEGNRDRLTPAQSRNVWADTRRAMVLDGDAIESDGSIRHGRPRLPAGILTECAPPVYTWHLQCSHELFGRN
jgi:hypothetical protein